jgi:hypothetical protein
MAAADGALPSQLQDVIADVAEPFGVDLHSVDSKDAPSDHSDGPGHSESAPGQQGQPGESENAPGHGGEGPGRSETAPGHSGAENNRPTSPPVPEANDHPAPGLEDGVGRPSEPRVQGHGSGSENNSIYEPGPGNGRGPSPQGEGNTGGNAKDKH